MKIINISTSQLFRDTRNVIKQIKKDKLKLDTILAILRGGAVAGIYLSHHLRVPLEVVALQSYNNSYKGGKLKVQPEYDLIVNRLRGNVLVCDELVDRGVTMLYVLKSLRKNSRIKKVYTVSIYVKKDSIYIPDYYSRVVRGWIKFEYESKI